MKPLKPGQLCTVNNQLYRAKKRIRDCYGCDLNVYTCPNIRRDNTREKHIPCWQTGIILKRV